MSKTYRTHTTHLAVLAAAVFFLAPAVCADVTPDTTPEPPATAAPQAVALPEAPFGLKWLASRQDVADMGMSLKTPMATDFGDSYVVSHLPKELPDLHYAVLSFGYNDELIRITAIGTGFENDEDGNRIKARYNELDQALQKKYGAGKPQVHIDKEYDGNKFEQGLRYKKNWMYTEFFPPDLHIELSVFDDIPRTRWRIIFEYVPGMARLKHERKQAEDQAL